MSTEEEEDYQRTLKEIKRAKARIYRKRFNEKQKYIASQKERQITELEKTVQMQSMQIREQNQLIQQLQCTIDYYQYKLGIVVPK
jgi:uncharacterized coiled-coil protein SlyX